VTTISSLKSKLLNLLALGCLVGLMTLISALFKLPLRSVGTVDFVQYWSAWRVMLDGGNCYDPAVMHEVQSSLTTTPFPLTFSWNPPWTYVLLSPWLMGPFDQSASAWMLTQVVLLCVITVITPYALSSPGFSPLTGALVATIFFPILTSIYWGQLGVLLAASVASFLFFERRGQLFWAGVALLPLTTKPHLFLLFIPPALIWLRYIPRRERRFFLLGSLGGFAILVTLTIVLAPASILSWLQSFSASTAPTIESHAVVFRNWKTATIATWTRIALQELTNNLPNWPLVAFPVVGTLGSLAYFLKNTSPISWTTITPPLLCLSLMTSSYGWTFDQSVLLVCQIVIICRARCYVSRLARYGMMSVAFSVQLAAILLSHFTDAPHHYFAWIPVAMLGLLIADRWVRLQDRTAIEACGTYAP
jgi:hypothetical protein